VDTIVRRPPDRDKMRKLQPVIDRRYGRVTAANASPLTDGAAVCLLMSEEKARALGYQPIGFVRDYAYAALDPRDMLLAGPSYATPLVLDRVGMNLRDMDLMDMHEAFAAQVVANLKLMASRTFAEEKLGRSQPVGEVDMDRFNVLGGSVAIGHPFGATGIRMIVQTLRELRRRGGAHALITLCAGGAMGVSMVLDRE